MDNSIRIESISEINAFHAIETLHPLVSVIDFSKTAPKSFNTPIESWSWTSGFYHVFLKNDPSCTIRYGRQNYDYQEGTLVFIGPEQVVHVDNFGENYKPKGYWLVFHPDLIHCTSLGRHMHEYTFFGYQSHEALHISKRERKLILECFAKIKYELKQGLDKHSKRLIASNIELFVNYCIRFYDRQFITRDTVNKGILERFETLLTTYHQSDKPQTLGLPSVGYCAGELNLSANYFGGLIKKETGLSAQEYVQFRLIEVAK